MEAAVQERNDVIEGLADVTEEDYAVETTKVSIDQLLGKSPKLIGKIKSFQDKIDDIRVLPSGNVVHNILRVTKEMKYIRGKPQRTMGKYREWPSI